MCIFICLWGPWARLWTLKHVDPWHKLLIRISICDKTTWRHPHARRSTSGQSRGCVREHRRGNWENRGRLLNHSSKAATARTQAPLISTVISKHLSASAQGVPPVLFIYTLYWEKRKFSDIVWSMLACHQL